MSASQWLWKHVLIGDYFPNVDKRGIRYHRTCYDKAAPIISQAWLWSGSFKDVDNLEQSVLIHIQYAGFNFKYDTNRVLSCC